MIKKSGKEKIAQVPLHLYGQRIINAFNTGDICKLKIVLLLFMQYLFFLKETLEKSTECIVSDEI